MKSLEWSYLFPVPLFPTWVLPWPHLLKWEPMGRAILFIGRLTYSDSREVMANTYSMAALLLSSLQGSCFLGSGTWKGEAGGQHLTEPAHSFWRKVAPVAQWICVLSSFTQLSVLDLNKGPLFWGVVFITQVRKEMGHDYKTVHILHCKFVEKYICIGEILKSYFPGCLYSFYSWKYASILPFWDRVLCMSG